MLMQSTSKFLHNSRLLTEQWKYIQLEHNERKGNGKSTHYFPVASNVDSEGGRSESREAIVNLHQYQHNKSEPDKIKTQVETETQETDFTLASEEIVFEVNHQRQQRPMPSKHWSIKSEQILLFSNYPKTPKLCSANPFYNFF